jgi:hypothetical protein
VRPESRSRFGLLQGQRATKVQLPTFNLEVDERVFMKSLGISCNFLSSATPCFPISPIPAGPMGSRKMATAGSEQTVVTNDADLFDSRNPRSCVHVVRAHSVLP